LHQLKKFYDDVMTNDIDMTFGVQNILSACEGLEDQKRFLCRFVISNFLIWK